MGSEPAWVACYPNLEHQTPFSSMDDFRSEFFEYMFAVPLRGNALLGSTATNKPQRKG